MNVRFRFCLYAAGAALLVDSSTAQAGPLTEARLTKIINDVTIVDPAAGPRKATLQDVIKDQIGVKTGIKSRSELLFEDNTLTRIGPESYFSFNAGTRDMTLQQGTMLLQVPKGLGGAKIRTAAVTASITGTTIMIEHQPGKLLKVLVLEGSLRLSVNGTFGDSLLLLPGKMVIMPPNAKRIPDPVSVDLKKIVQTSSLVKMSKHEKALPSTALIENEIQVQQHEKGRANLVDTNLVIIGGGSKVTMTSDDVLSAIDRADNANNALLLAANTHATPTPAPAAATPTPIPQLTPAPTPLFTPTPAPSATPGFSPTPTATPTPTPEGSATPTPNPTASPTPTATPNPTPSATPTPTASATPTASPTPTATSTPTATATPTATPTPSGTPSASPSPTATPTASPTATPSPSPSASPSPTPDEDRTVNFGTSDHPLDSDVTLNDEIDLTNGHGSGNVNVTTNASATINTKIKVSDAEENKNASKKGGNIAVESRKTTGTAISVTSSAQLLSLLSTAAVGAGGSIKFVSAGGDVNINGAKMQADRGTIDIRNDGASGSLNINNATLNASTVKARAFGANGTLNIGGGSISADSTINLYAGGSNGTVKFTDNVTLSGNSVKTISGNTVTIVNGKIVSISGPAPASVFTSHPNYSGSGGNGSTTGTFGGKGATTSPLSAGPGPGG